jgi:thiol:disulfide interchange protein
MGPGYVLFIFFMLLWSPVGLVAGVAYLLILKKLKIRPRSRFQTFIVVVVSVCFGGAWLIVKMSDDILNPKQPDVSDSAQQVDAGQFNDFSNGQSAPRSPP